MLVRDVELLRFFLERGADPNHQDAVGHTPLHFACQWRNSKAQIELLLQFGTTIELKANGHTPVEFAMRRPNLEAVKILEPLIQDPDLKREIARWLGERERPKND
jgi:ankyrin repeat protein